MRLRSVEWAENAVSLNFLRCVLLDLRRYNNISMVSKPLLVYVPDDSDILACKVIGRFDQYSSGQ
jgi:hypothetical protein